MDAESGELSGGGVAADSWQLHAPFPCRDLVLNGADKPLQNWALDPDCTLNDSESEDVLHGVDPNEVFPSGPPAESSSESDSGISEEPVMERPVTMATTQPAPATIYQVVYDLSSVGGVQSEGGAENVFSIQLDEWSSQVLFSDSCVVSELPVVSAAAVHPPELDGDALYPELQLTDEEQKLLTQEGVSLPSNLPLTKVTPPQLSAANHSVSEPPRRRQLPSVCPKHSHQHNISKAPRGNFSKFSTNVHFELRMN
ncbi:cyclic AMP-responsive element-binding protein 3-like protein 4 isoform X2 [Plectropomus leopardus]|uniref:cyclic AMP-responsive element-binding protein 3-like protein 4 isoform X2 n=1 Tax=Plectropomus leopardus TaxID=160734 RepID=UPI001C4B99A7|nr:cyclic AMP-responsive element-binding protein 3-like protein 4 isoform X2 [Plectropomus leopardus]